MAEDILPPTNPLVNSRRHFLITAPLGIIGTLAACRGETEKPGEPTSNAKTSPPPNTPGAPPAFNTAPPVGPEVGPATFAEA
ncbi:MAG: hypothetical protein M3R65_09330, partial [Gemmatimonadota bacterium]|nr:hypothetical protein [Gemmatimonadota bacterium]